MNLHEQIKPYVEKGLVSVETDGDLSIYNYTYKCQWKRAWDNITMQCRGLILNKKGDIIARPFRKFFNLNEQSETMMQNLPAEVPEVSDKLDGSMGILYKWNEEYKIATRGSFKSEQAIEATNILQEKYPHRDFDRYSAYTILFEIIYPRNRVVVDYKDVSDIFVIGMVEKATGWDLPYSVVRIVADELHLNYTPFEYINMDDVISKINDATTRGIEGYVLRYSNGLRLKIKTEEYKRLHKLLNGVSEKTIWELLSNHDSVESYLENVPDEFHEWFMNTVNRIQKEYETIEQELRNVFFLKPPTEDRKVNALYFAQQKKYLHAALFAMFDLKDYNKYIWKQLKPAGGTTFKTVIAE